MVNALIGKKLNQTQKFLENGRRIPVTEIAVSDNVVLQVKNLEKDGYNAVQLGYGAKKNGTKAVLGHVKKAGLEKAPAVVKEVTVQGEALLQSGELVSVGTVFKAGDIVDVTGTSKGKGFAGVVKRHNFRGGPKTHGQSDRHRAPGSIGQTTTPGRVYKGKRMAGHMGVDTVTVSNLTVVDVDDVNKKLYVLGLVPGHKNAFLLITQKGEDKKFVPLLHPMSAANAVEEVVEEVEAETTEQTVVEEQQEAPVSEETKEAVEAAATPELVESVEQKVEEEVAQTETKEEEPVEEESAADVQEDSGEPKKEEENGK